MKKYLLMPVLIFALSAVFAGCGEKKEASAPEPGFQSGYTAENNQMPDLQQNSSMQEENQNIAEQNEAQPDINAGKTEQQTNN